MRRRISPEHRALTPEAVAILRALLACGFILALPFGLRAALRSPRVRALRPFEAFGARASRDRTLRVVETIFLPDRASLHVVEAAGRRLLVGRSAATLGVLCDLGACDDGR